MRAGGSVGDDDQGGLTREQKADHFLNHLHPMLMNDLRTVIECRCEEHGRPGPGPNFAACFLCLMACEVVGRLNAPTGCDGFLATRHFLNQVGDLAKRSLKNA